MSISCCDSISKKYKKNPNQINPENENDKIINNYGNELENYNKNNDIDDIGQNKYQHNNENHKYICNQVKDINGIIGLVNLGLSCYFNSAIQTLKNVFPLTLYLLKNYRKFNKSEFRFTYNYCKLIGNLINQKTVGYFTPIDFFNCLQELTPNIQIGEQNDSSICVMYILKHLEREIKKPGEPNPDIIESLNEEDKEKFKCYINKLYYNKNSYILDYFYGFQQDIYECRNKNCKYKNNNSFQGFTVLNLPIVTCENNHIINLESLETAIKHYQLGRLHKEEEGFDCSRCKKRDIMTKSIIISYPKILIINFKRIGEQFFYNHKVEVPSELTIDKYKYELIGFIKHIGGAKSGHNIAICKNFFDYKWYEYDDHEVKEIKHINYKDKNDKPDTKNGFLFFYKNSGIFANIETKDEKNFIIQASLDLRSN